MYQLIFNDSDGFWSVDATDESIDVLKDKAAKIILDMEGFDEPLEWVAPVDCRPNAIMMADYAQNDFTMFYEIVELSEQDQ